jgi:enoyl-CoA hydratase/carnithine racemase
VDYEQITYETRGEIALITLNRPERLNAWTRRMSVELADAVTTANDDNSLGAIVFTGAGRGFCAGADIESQFKAQLDGETDLTRPQADAGQGGSGARGAGGGGEHRPTDWVQLCRQSKPMVAAINGPAIGLGLTLILPMDRLVASDQAKLSCRFVKMGITPELASSHFLVQRCGWGPASDLALSGRIIPAQEALAVNLVDQVVPHDQLLDAAFERAQEYASNPDPQLRMIKQLLTENAAETDLATVQRREGEALARAFKTPEFAEAVDAFLNKRPAKFR